MNRALFTTLQVHLIIQPPGLCVSAIRSLNYSLFLIFSLYLAVYRWQFNELLMWFQLNSVLGICSSVPTIVVNVVLLCFANGHKIRKGFYRPNILFHFDCCCLGESLITSIINRFGEREWVYWGWCWFEGGFRFVFICKLNCSAFVSLWVL